MLLCEVGSKECKQCQDRLVQQKIKATINTRPHDRTCQNYVSKVNIDLVCGYQIGISTITDRNCLLN